MTTTTKLAKLPPCSTTGASLIHLVLILMKMNLKKSYSGIIQIYTLKMINIYTILLANSGTKKHKLIFLYKAWNKDCAAHLTPWIHTNIIANLLQKTIMENISSVNPILINI
tara:strand:+ start:1232 stop:1567 length:336 start_codon:yes stop_codon:yes gene_type:complete